MFEYGVLDEILKLFYSDNVVILQLVLVTSENLLNTLLINPNDKTFILDKLDEFMVVSKLEELCNHPFEVIRNNAFDLLSLCGVGNLYDFRF